MFKYITLFGAIALLSFNASSLRAEEVVKEIAQEQIQDLFSSSSQAPAPGAIYVPFGANQANTLAPIVSEEAEAVEKQYRLRYKEKSAFDRVPKPQRLFNNIPNHRE